MEPSKEQSNNGYNQPGLIRRIISYPLTSLEIGTYLLKCALFGDEVEGHDPASELEKELCRVHLEEEELPEEVKDLFWERYNRFPKPENKRYNAAALVEKIGKGLAEAYKKGIFRSIASFFSDKKRKTGLELAEDIAKEYRDLRNRISTSKAFLNRFSNKLYSSETNGGYDTTAANVYATSQAIIEEESKKLNLVHNVDPWKHIFLQLWNKVSIDYAFKGSSAVVNDWKEAMRTYNNRMRDMQKIAKKTKMPEVAEEMLEVLVKDTHKAISSHILDRFERGASDKDNNEQIDKLIKFYTSFSLAYKHILYPNLRLEKTRSQRRHMFINNVVRADLIDKLTNLNLAQLNGHLNVRYLSGLIRSYERFVRSLCPPEQNGQLDKEMLAIAQHFRQQIYEKAIDLYYSKAPEHIRRPELDRFKKLYERFCFNNRQIFQPADMPDQEFRKIVHQDLNGLKRAGRIRLSQKKEQRRKEEAEKQSLIIEIANLMQDDIGRGLLEQCGQTTLEDFLEFFRDGHYRMGKTFDQFLEDREMFKPGSIDWSDLAILGKIGLEAAANFQPSPSFQMFDLVAAPTSDNQIEASIFNPKFYHPKTGEEISAEEFKKLMDEQENPEQA